MIGVNPYSVGPPACNNYGMQPSTRYSGLCLNFNSQTYYTPQNNVITQNTYTFKSERVNPPKYQTFKKTPTTQTPYNTVYSYKTLFQPQQPQTFTTDPDQAYLDALNAYNKPNLSYEDAEQAYRTVLSTYAAVQNKPAQQEVQQQQQQHHQQQSKTTSFARSFYRPTVRSRYDWSVYFRH